MQCCFVKTIKKDLGLTVIVAKTFEVIKSHLSILWHTCTCTCQGTEVYRHLGWHRDCWGNTWNSEVSGSAVRCNQEGRSKWHCQVQVHQLIWIQSSSLRSGSSQDDTGPYGGSTRLKNLAHTWTYKRTQKHKNQWQIMQSHTPGFKHYHTNTDKVEKWIM